MMMKKILEQKKSPLKAVCYDIAEQREYTEQDFRITLSYPIRNGWRIFYAPTASTLSVGTNPSPQTLLVRSARERSSNRIHPFT